MVNGHVGVRAGQTADAIGSQRLRTMWGESKLDSEWW
jgi:hypothetical protein